jgi:signal transduction histidine kinase
MKAFVSKNRDGLPTVSRGRLVLLAIAAILGPGLLALTSFRNTEVNHLVMASGMFLLFLLTFLRIAGLMRSIERNSTLLQVQGLELSTAVEGLKHAEAARRNLLDAVHSTAERERSSLAVDLHDGPIQHLTTLTLEADLATVGLNDGDRALAQKALLALEEGLSAEVESLRVLMTDLRPPVLDERGLAQALSDHVAAFAIRTKIVCDVDLDIERRLDRETETILYRIAQEALINVAKHSGAGHMFLRCQASDLEIMMEINDDGMGFDPLKTDMSGRDGHLGLASIRERVEFAGGTCSVDSAIGRGTRIALTLNLERNDDAQVAHIAG